jgi:hypothetical protein
MIAIQGLSAIAVIMFGLVFWAEFFSHTLDPQTKVEIIETASSDTFAKHAAEVWLKDHNAASPFEIDKEEDRIKDLVAKDKLKRFGVH